MKKNYRSKLVGVFGYPVDENPSVIMNEVAFKSIGIDWRYITTLVDPKDLKDAFLGLRAMNYEGINLTIPHKIEAMKYIDEISDATKLIGAINIVINRDGKLYADNTDGKGFVECLEQKGFIFKNKKVVLLGSGGAARAIAVESALKDIAEITIINRTLEKAEEIVEIIKNNTKVVARAIKMQSVQNIPSCDLLINATSIGLASDSEMPNINYDDISSDMMVQDVVINPVETSFLRQAEQRGAAISTGLDMLVYQGKIGIRLWTGHEVDVDILKGSLRNE